MIDKNPRDMLRLRPYQEEAVDAVFKAWTEGVQRPASVLPTGAGKTVIFSHLAQRFRDWRTAADGSAVRPRRVVVLVHRDELADQTLAKLSVIAPHLKTGKVKAADNDVTADVMVCSVQTLARRARMEQLLGAQSWAGDIGLVVVDECHHALADSYRNVMAALGCYSGSTDHLAVGFTATMARGDGHGLGDIWQDVVYQRSILWMIARGFLVDVRARMIEMADLNLRSVKRSGGDYTASSLGEAMQAAGAPEIIKQVLVKHAADRRSVLVFVPTVALAHETADALTEAGLTSGVVSGATPRAERLALYEQFRRGAVKVIVNCMVLTEGADFPYADCAVIARPTSNETLFTQMVGRVLRPSPTTGKSDALVLVVSGEGGSIRTLIDLEPAIRDMEDGESLAEAYERNEAEADKPVKAGSVRFELKHRDLDLFKASPSYQWLRTPAGLQFIPCGTVGSIALWASSQPGLWDVIWIPNENKVPWERLHTGLDLGMAMAWGESEADERADLNTGKKASWRKKPASEGQIRYARTLRVQVPEGARAGDAADLISIALVARRTDRHLKRVA